jgi:hypothetical protein
VAMFEADPLQRLPAEVDFEIGQLELLH